MCSEAFLHLFRSGLQLAVSDVGVDVHGGRQLGVAKEHLRRFRIHAAFQQGGGVAVPDLVRRDGDAAGVPVRIIQSGEMIVCQEAAVWLREQVAFSQLFGEQLGQRREKRNVPASGVRFWLLDVGRVAYMIHRFFDVHKIFLPVNVGAGESQRLAPAAAGIVNEESEQAERKACAFFYEFDLLRRGRVPVGLRQVSGRLHSAGRVVAYNAIHFGFAEDLADDLQLGHHGFPGAGGGEVLDILVDLLRGDLTGKPSGKFFLGPGQRRTVAFLGIVLQGRFDLRPPCVRDFLKYGGFFCFDAVRLPVEGLDLLPDLFVGLPPEGLTLAVDPEDGLVEAVRPDVVFRVSCHGLFPPEADLDAMEVQIQRIHGNQTQEHQQSGNNPVPDADALLHHRNDLPFVGQALFKADFFSLQGFFGGCIVIPDVKNSSMEIPRTAQIGPAVLMDGAFDAFAKKLLTVDSGTPDLSAMS